MTEREKMLAGLAYDARDDDLVAGRRECRRVLLDANRELDEERRMAVYAGLLGGFGEGSFIEAPLYCDYGDHLYLGEECFLNTNVVALDCAPIRLGDRVQVGPGVQLLAADHPRDATSRARGEELAKPITIGSDAWIGAGAILCPGLSVGAGSVIGAGSVVTRDVPKGVIAAGNPCRVIREL